MDFFSTCTLNDPELERLFNDLISTLTPYEVTILIHFTDKIINEGQVSINMRPTTLLDFLASSRYLNIYQWADLVLRRAAKSKDEILKDKLGDYYEKRITFDHHFDNGEDFNYGTLNIGGLGAERYGEYSVIVDREKIKSVGKLGYLDADSLRTYVTTSLTIDDATLSRHCSSDSYNHFLAALKHAHDILKESENRWPIIVCNSDDYIEAIFDVNLQPDQIITVRIAKSDFDLYWEYAFNEHREKLSELDRFRVDIFARIDEYLYNLGINWQEVNYA
jgi:hypothetical protein